MTMTANPAWPSRPPDHLIDLAEWDALPEDSSARYELVEGVMVAAPRPLPRHRDLVLELGGQLTEFALADDAGAAYRLVATPDRSATLAFGPTISLAT